MDQLSADLKDLELQNGKILNSVKNLKLINNIRNKIERFIVSEGYKQEVKKFVEAFNLIESLQHKYFAAFNQKFTPNKTLPIIKEAAIDKTLNDLLSQGLQSNVVDKVYDILNQNVTTGGTYASLTKQLTDHITNTSSGEGQLQKYARTITTDAINQYSAQYHDTLAQDLSFNWGRYIGSNLTTTREFCEVLTEKEWVHRTELPEILKGNIDGHQCKLNNKGLPLGMIPGTTVDNFKIRRGGYNCGHQFFWVPDSSVPKEVKDRLGKPPVPKKEEPVVLGSASETILKRNKVAIDLIARKKIKVYPDLLDKLTDPQINITTSKEQGAHYDPRNNKIVIGTNPRREKSEYFRDMVMAHETAHAIHNQRGIITRDKVDQSFKDHFNELKTVIRGKAHEIEELLWEKHKEDPKNTNKNEQIATLLDVIGSLTYGLYGSGHSGAYYNNYNGAEKEIFAHGMSLLKVKNDFADISPEMEEVVKKMIEYSRNILK